MLKKYSPNGLINKQLQSCQKAGENLTRNKVFHTKDVKHWGNIHLWVCSDTRLALMSHRDNFRQRE